MIIEHLKKMGFILETQFDFKGHKYLYFNYSVSKYKIYLGKHKFNTLKSLRRFTNIIVFLNPHKEKEDFLHFLHCLRENHFSWWPEYPSEVDKVLNYAIVKFYKNEYGPKVKGVQLVFNPEFCLSKGERASIRNRFYRKPIKIIPPNTIHSCFEELLAENKKITFKEIAIRLQRSEKVISRSVKQDSDLYDYYLGFRNQKRLRK
jgi:hypothetical protein